MAGGNPVQSSSRTFLSALADINSDPALTDKPDWFKRLQAGILDIASILINAEANNGYLRTALTQRAVTDLSALIDYSIPQNVTASGTQMFDAAASAVMPFTVAQADVAANGPSGIGNSALRYGARGILQFNTLTEVVVQDAGHISTVTGQIVVASVFTMGEKVRASSSVTLPTGLAAATDYFAIYVDATHITLAATRALAFSGTPIIPSAVGSGNLTLTRLSRAATLYQEIDVAQNAIGQSDGVTQWQEFDIPQGKILSGTLVVTVNAVQYTQLQTLALSLPTDTVYRLYFNTDGTATIRFGNGIYGIIPPAGAVYVAYSYGGGSKSNVANQNQVVGYAGGDARITGCYNSTAYTGGADPELMTASKKNAPLLLKARSRFITSPDGVALAMSQGGLSQVVVNKNVYGILSAQVVGVASGGGSPSSATRISIANYLASLSLFNSIVVVFDPGTFTAVTAALSVHIDPGYSFSLVSPYILLAVGLFFSEVGQQIYNDFLAGGVSLAVADINTIFGTSFAAADYSVISSILNILGVVGSRTFGDYVTLSNLYALCEAIPGVGYVILTSSTPAVPYQSAASEILSISKNLGSAITLTAV